MKATVSQDFKTIFRISRQIYQEQPLLKQYVWRQVRIDILTFALILTFIGLGFFTLPLLPTDLMRTIAAGVVAVVFVYVATLINRSNYARMLITADSSLRGEVLKARDVEQVMVKRRGLLAKWVALDLSVAALTASLRKIDDTVPFLGSILSIIGDAVWQTVSFFSLTIIVLHGEEPLASVKASASAVKETWKQGKLRYGFGGLFQSAISLIAMIVIFVLGMGAVAGVIALILSGLADAVVLTDVAKRALMVGVGVTAVPVLAFLSYFSYVVQAHYAVCHVALYLFAVHKYYVGVFPLELLEKAVEPVEKRGLFRRKVAS